MSETNVKQTIDMTLNLSDAQTYSQVDGLSLQNLFYVKNKYFPNAYMFSRSARGGDNYFDTPRILEHFKTTVSEDENAQFVVYSCYDMDTKEEQIGFSIILNKSSIFARIENNITESYILYGHDNKEALGKFVEELKEFYVAPEEEKNNLFLVAQDASGFKLNKWHIKEVVGFDIKKQYNDDFPEIDGIIRDFIDEENKSGLLILLRVQVRRLISEILFLLTLVRNLSSYHQVLLQCLVNHHLVISSCHFQIASSFLRIVRV